jgi:type I restriction enzyme S subunit
MANRWREVTIGDIAARTRNALVGGPFGSNLVSRDYVDVGVPVIRGQNMGDRWVAGEFAFVTEDKARSLEANLARPGDIIFTQRGTIGQVCLVPEKPHRCYLVSQSQMKLTVDPALADPLYVYYAFCMPEQKDYARRNAIQTGVPHTNLGILRDTIILLPPLSEQRAIARILGSLDDKIELNRRMNATLEAMARALFKAWFVDFEPVRAKLAGRETGLPREIADLFPAALVASGVGEMPEGWQVGVLGDVAEERRRGVDPEQVDPKTPYIGLEHMPRGAITLNEWGSAAGLESNKLFFKQGEILFGKLRPYFRKVGIAPLDGICSTDIVVLSPQDPAWFGFVLGHASSAAFVDYTNAGSTGTKMPRTSWNEMARYQVVLPTQALARAFTAVIWPLIERMTASIQESRTLAALRDALLPKLISGEVRVQNVD